jgi:hypothetical protein
MTDATPADLWLIWLAFGVSVAGFAGSLIGIGVIVGARRRRIAAGAGAPASGDIIVPPAIDQLPSQRPDGARWSLRISGDRATPRVLWLDGRRHMYIGRSGIDAPADVVIDHPGVSRRHIKLEYNPVFDELTLHVQQTGNGTYLGVERRPLPPGDTITLRPGDEVWLGHHIAVQVRRD